MARKLRVEYEGAVYHVMNRGDRRELIFLDDEDRQRFLTTLNEACTKTGWQVHAYCLIPNHFHLVVETPQPNLVAGMKWLLGTYTGRFNRRHKYFGHLFSGRYKALIVDGSGTGYLKTVCDYVHLNPARAKLVPPEQPLAEYRWSSWPDYLKSPGKRPAWLRVDRLLGEYRVPQDSAAGRRHLAETLELRRRAPDGGEFKAIRRGWFLGNEALKQELLGQMAERKGPEHFGAERRESELVKADRLLAAGLKKARWTEADLARQRKGHPVKVRLAQQLRAQTTLTVGWIAGRLQMGSRGYAVQLLWRAAR
jgi:REP element-mobilizing transposase RayT